MNAQVSEFAMIPVKDLYVSPDNVRTSPSPPHKDAELKASIRSEGILQALLVKPGENGRFAVHAGGRRLAQTQALVKDKVFEEIYPVPCMILPEGADAHSISMAENLARDDMHPIDEFEAFHALHHVNHVTIPDIAARHGKTEREVRKRLALGGVHPELRKLCKQGKLDLDCLMAYAGTSDQSRQLALYKSLSKQRRQNAEWMVRDALNEKVYSTDDNAVKFIGLDAYRAAGGQVEQDLFPRGTDMDDEDEGPEEDYFRLVDTHLVDKLLNEKLQDALQKAGKGWKWAEVDQEYTYHSSKYRRIEQTGKFTAEQMASSGVIIKVGHGGKLEIVWGLLKQGDKAPKGKAGTKEKAKTGADSYSQSLQDDLNKAHRGAAQLALLHEADPMLLIRAFYFELCLDAFRPVSSYTRAQVFHISYGVPGWQRGGPEPEDSVEALNKKRKKLAEQLNTSWLDLKNIQQSFLDFLALSDLEQQKLVAYSLAEQLQRKPYSAILDTMLHQFNANLAKYWRPTAKGFFARIKGADRLEIASKLLGTKDLPPDVKKMKKDALSLYLENKVKGQSPEDAWMPEHLAIKPPKPKAAPKAKAKTVSTRKRKS